MLDEPMMGNQNAQKINLLIICQLLFRKGTSNVSRVWIKRTFCTLLMET